jgi:hypothetical protein
MDHFIDHLFQQALHTCQDPSLNVRLSALETIEKEYLDLVKAEFLMLLLRKTSIYQEQIAILGIISQLGPGAPISLRNSWALKPSYSKQTL